MNILSKLVYYCSAVWSSSHSYRLHLQFRNLATLDFDIEAVIIIVLQVAAADYFETSTNVNYFTLYNFSKVFSKVVTQNVTTSKNVQ